MPLLFRQDGFVVRVHGPPREHPPPHVHVELSQRELVIIRLDDGDHRPIVWAVYGMNARDVLKAYRIVEREHERIRQAWEALHGQDHNL
jgi:hypothetical protein